MKSNFIYLALIAIILLNACKKDDPTVYTLSGHVYNNCAMTPYINKRVYLYKNLYYLSLTGSYTIPKQFKFTTTDTNGYFSFEFSNEDNISVSLWDQSDVILDGIPAGVSDNNLSVLDAVSPVYLKISINVINAHTSSDTLIIRDFRGGTSATVKLPGPLQSHVLYTAQYINPYQFYNGRSEILNWNIKNTSYGTNQVKNFVINKYCGDTISVAADIY